LVWTAAQVKSGADATRTHSPGDELLPQPVADAHTSETSAASDLRAVERMEVTP